MYCHDNLTQSPDVRYLLGLTENLTLLSMDTTIRRVRNRRNNKNKPTTKTDSSPDLHIIFIMTVSCTHWNYVQLKVIAGADREHLCSLQLVMWWSTSMFVYVLKLNWPRDVFMFSLFMSSPAWTNSLWERTAATTQLRTVNTPVINRYSSMTTVARPADTPVSVTFTALS